MNLRKKYILPVIMGITVLGFSIPSPSRATDWFAIVKYGLDVAAEAAAHAALKILQQKLVDTINKGGLGGRPAYVQNWTNFITNSEYTGENTFRAMLSTTNLCDYFGKNLKGSYGLSATDKIALPGVNTRVGDLLPYNVRARCTLPAGFDLDKYSKDFAGNGGWGAYVRLLEPQNNPWGAALLAQDELSKQRGLAQSAATNEALAGKGFTSTRGSCKLQFAGKCLVQGDVKTPGSVLSDTASNVIEADLNKFINVNGAKALITVAVDFAVNRLADWATAPRDDGTSEVSTAKSLTQEFCTADKPSSEAASFVKKNFPKAYEKYSLLDSGFSLPGLPDIPAPPGLPGTGGGESYCTQFRSDENMGPYERCITACLKAVENIPSSVSVPEPPDYGNIYRTPTPTPSCNPATANCTTPTQTPTPTPTGTLTPPPPLNLSTAVIAHGQGDVASWAQTTTITSANVPSNADISLEFSKKGDPRTDSSRWPCQLFDGSAVSSNPDQECAQYTVWLFEYIDGQWYGAGSVIMWFDRPGTGGAPSGYSIYRQLKENWVYAWPPMSNHSLRSGEQVGFMVTAGNSRSPMGTILKERSNVFMVTLP